MKLLRRPSCVSRRMLHARCRCAPRAEEAKMFAGLHVCLCLTVMCTFKSSNNKTRVCLMGPDQHPRHAKRVTGA
eukprot:5366760-Prymnesium_polylepis.1